MKHYGVIPYIMDTPSPHPGSLSSLDSKLRHSDFTLLLSRVGLMRLEIINLMFGAVGTVEAEVISIMHLKFHFAKLVGPAEISCLKSTSGQLKCVICIYLFI